MLKFNVEPTRKQNHMQMKFVIFQDDMGLKPVVFPRDIIHVEMVNVCPGIIVSAGFVDITTKEIWGSSNSIGISSRPEDVEIFNEYFGNGFSLLK